MAQTANNLVRAINGSKSIMIAALDSKDIVTEMERIHHTSAVASAALGRLLTGASLMGSFLKSETDSVTVRVGGGGPLGNLLAVSDGLGNVRGYVANQLAHLPVRAQDGKLDVGGAVGTDGVISVVRDMGRGEPYIGQVALVSGEIGDDITQYYAQSEQIPGACALGVLVNPDLSIQAAGGFLLHVLPGAPEEDVRRMEETIAKLPSMTYILQNGGGPEDIIRAVFGGVPYSVLDSRRVVYKCYCSEAKTKNILVSLGQDEIRDMLAENGTAEVKCHFCDAEYHIDLNEIMEYFSQQHALAPLDKP